MPGGGSITCVETTEWATFQVTQDPGKVVALVASTGMVLGLCLSLFVRRRRVWVRVTPVPAGGGPGGGRTVVEVAGLARTGAEAFTDEFTSLTGRVRETAPPSASPSADQQEHT
jgi:cytochrome c biogenesis protein